MTLSSVSYDDIVILSQVYAVDHSHKISYGSTAAVTHTDKANHGTVMLALAMMKPIILHFYYDAH